MDAIWVIPTARTLLGALFLVAAADGVAYFLRGRPLLSPRMTPGAERFMSSIKDTFLYPLKTLLDAVAGSMLLLDFHSPLALLLLLPSITVIVLFHVLLNRSGIPAAVVLVVLTVPLLIAYLEEYRPLLGE